MQRDDEFELYDLAVVVEAIEGNCTCAMQVGDRFFLRGGNIGVSFEGDSGSVDRLVVEAGGQRQVATRRK